MGGGGIRYQISVDFQHVQNSRESQEARRSQSRVGNRDADFDFLEKEGTMGCLLH